MFVKFLICGSSADELLSSLFSYVPHRTAKKERLRKRRSRQKMGRRKKRKEEKLKERGRQTKQSQRWV